MYIYIYISFQFYLKPNLLLFYIPYILMFLGFKDKISNSQKFLSLFYFINLSFSVEVVIPFIFFENKQNSTHHPLCKVGEIQL